MVLVYHQGSTTRGKAVAEEDWGGEAVRKAVQDVQAAVTASIIASAVVISAGSS